MKIKNLLMAFAFIGLAASCSNDDNVSVKPESTGPFDLKIKVHVPKSSSTRVSDDTYVGNGSSSEINTATLYLLESSDDSLEASKLTVHSAVELSADDIKDLKLGHYIIKDIPDEIKTVALMINGNIAAPEITNQPLDNILKMRIENLFSEIQPTDTYKGISNSPMYGYATSGFQEVAPGTGQNIQEANVLVTPQIARIQIYGNITTQIENFKVTRIFLDNFIDNYNEQTKFEVGQVIGEDLITKLQIYKNIFDYNEAGLPMYTTTAEGVYAYHLFPQKDASNAIDKDKNVKLLLEMEYDVDGTPALRYATLMLTKKSGTEPGDPLIGLEIDGGNIYTVNLGQIAWDGEDPDAPFKPEDGDEKPNMGDNATVNVEVQTWNEVITIPRP